jgi:hypothetical protein
MAMINVDFDSLGETRQVLAKETWIKFKAKTTMRTPKMYIESQKSYLKYSSPRIFTPISKWIDEVAHNSDWPLMKNL